MLTANAYQITPVAMHIPAGQVAESDRDFASFL
jgi:hypothetical protein